MASESHDLEPTPQSVSILTGGAEKLVSNSHIIPVNSVLISDHKTVLVKMKIQLMLKIKTLNYFFQILKNLNKKSPNKKGKIICQ